jgi:hypothetical protein
MKLGSTPERSGARPNTDLEIGLRQLAQHQRPDARIKLVGTSFIPCQDLKASFAATMCVVPPVVPQFE